MIHEEDVYKIGVLTKTHGVSGELSMTFTDDVFDRVDAEYLICRIEGILVPFFMEEYRFRSDTTVLVKFEDVDNEVQARRMTGLEVFFPKALAGEVEDGGYSWNYFVGFEVTDAYYGHLGKIVAVDDATVNVLFEIETSDGNELLVPASEELIKDIDHKQHKIEMYLPEGLLTLDQIEEN